MSDLSVGSLDRPRITYEDRERLHGHGGALVWFTGLSGSGKSTIANAVDHTLYTQQRHSVILDGDVVRTGLCNDLGFSPNDRMENIRRIGEVGRLFAQTGTIALVAVIAPYGASRDAVRKAMRPGRFIEVHVDAPLSVCEARDPKGLYKKARAGIIKNFTGLDAPYEVPIEPELRLDTSVLSPDEAAAKVIAVLQSRELI
ncbi:MAG: adenylyl-sulfate kinase [Nannocystaceae bacterium]|nr:adenylyl-sulfate kinase [Nannocystaceae bacterium]